MMMTMTCMHDGSTWTLEAIAGRTVMSCKCFFQALLKPARPDSRFGFNSFQLGVYIFVEMCAAASNKPE